MTQRHGVSRGWSLFQKWRRRRSKRRKSELFPSKQCRLWCRPFELNCSHAPHFLPPSLHLPFLLPSHIPSPLCSGVRLDTAALPGLCLPADTGRAGLALQSTTCPSLSALLPSVWSHPGRVWPGGRAQGWRRGPGRERGRGRAGMLNYCISTSFFYLGDLWPVNSHNRHAW